MGGARTLAGNTVPQEMGTKQTLRESGDQPLVRSTRGRSTGQLSRSYLRRLRSTRSTDYSSRLLRTRYRLGQLDTWFWVVLLRVLRFPPLFPKEHTKEKIKRDREKIRKDKIKTKCKSN